MRRFIRLLHVRGLATRLGDVDLAYVGQDAHCLHLGEQQDPLGEAGEALGLLHDDVEVFALFVGRKVFLAQELGKPTQCIACWDGGCR